MLYSRSLAKLHNVLSSQGCDWLEGSHTAFGLSLMFSPLDYKLLKYSYPFFFETPSQLAYINDYWCLGHWYQSGNGGGPTTDKNIAAQMGQLNQKVSVHMLWVGAMYPSFRYFCFPFWRVAFYAFVFYLCSSVSIANPLLPQAYKIKAVNLCIKSLIVHRRSFIET